MTLDTIIKNAASALAADYNASEISVSEENGRLPSKDEIIKILKNIQRVIFPGYFGNENVISASEEYFAGNMLTEIYKELKPQIETAILYRKTEAERNAAAERAEEICRILISKIPEIRRLLLCDVEAGYNGDPAAKSKAEIIVSYPGLFAIFVYRIAHILYLERVPLIPRIMTEYAHSQTGIDINAGAVIGEYFFIDHGTGVVIGETTVIGNNVSLYQGVTLGGTGKEKGKRHPTIGDYVVVACGAKVLGSFTVGESSKIGAGSVVLKEVPPYSTVVGIPGRVVVQKGKRLKASHSERDVDLNHNRLPDPIEDQIIALQHQVALLQHRVEMMDHQQDERCVGKMRPLK